MGVVVWWPVWKLKCRGLTSGACPQPVSPCRRSRSFGQMADCPDLLNLTG
ncbi:hypothetical protein Fuma_01975 [Fuerstiella marisgermanici]|uniref:Uncharacterized protein n=1 Tax=Fuerstiella marisgermanici TaxID=1891926 RepID=A0A1P8WE75_9PLAN|nr:hypothetical protein Fuma_01975 [Fuerstiella marisgermanici]